MKKIIILLLFIVVTSKAYSQIPVTDVAANTTLIAIEAVSVEHALSTAAVASSSAMMALLQQNEALMKKLSGFATGLSSVQKFIQIVNAVSCLAIEFNLSVSTAKETGYWNCWMDDHMNSTLNAAMQVMDVVNIALSVVLETDPANRIFLIENAMNKYLRIQASMRIFTTHVNRSVLRMEQQKVVRAQYTQIAAIQSIQGRN